MNEIELASAFLRPGTSDPVVVEALAGVPPGSAVVLANLLVDPLMPGSLEVDAAEQSLAVFQAFGWGRLAPEVVEYLRGLGLDPAEGSVGEPAVVEQVLELQGVVLPEGLVAADLGGLEWG